jgi:hypothetical protein
VDCPREDKWDRTRARATGGRTKQAEQSQYPGRDDQGPQVYPPVSPDCPTGLGQLVFCLGQLCL